MSKSRAELLAEIRARRTVISESSGIALFPTVTDALSNATEKFREVVDPNNLGQTVILDPSKHSAEVISTGNQYLDAFEAERILFEKKESFDVRKNELQRQIDEIRKAMQDQIDVLRQEIHSIDEAAYDIRREWKE